jgi:hypothetical protein
MAAPARALIERAYTLLCGDAAFDALVSRVIARVRSFMAVPDEVDDPVVLEELAALRGHLDGYQPAFRDAYLELLRQHLDEGSLTFLIQQLELGRALHDSARLRALDQAVRAEVLRLEQQLGEIPLYGPSAVARA